MQPLVRVASPGHGRRLVLSPLNHCPRTLCHAPSRSTYATVTNARVPGPQHVPAHPLAATMLPAAPHPPPQSAALPAKPEQMQLTPNDDRFRDYRSALQDQISVLRKGLDAMEGRTFTLHPQSKGNQGPLTQASRAQLLTKFSDYHRAIVLNIAFRSLHNIAAAHSLSQTRQSLSLTDTRFMPPPEWPASMTADFFRLSGNQARHLFEVRNEITHKSTIETFDAVLEMGPVPGLIDQEMIDFLTSARPFVVAAADEDTNLLTDSASPKFSAFIKMLKTREAKAKAKAIADAEEFAFPRSNSKLQWTMKQAREKQRRYHAKLRQEYLRGWLQGMSMPWTILFVVVIALFSQALLAQTQLNEALTKEMARQRGDQDVG